MDARNKNVRVSFEASIVHTFAQHLRRTPSSRQLCCMYCSHRLPANNAAYFASSMWRELEYFSRFCCPCFNKERVIIFGKVRCITLGIDPETKHPPGVTFPRSYSGLVSRRSWLYPKICRLLVVGGHLGEKVIVGIWSVIYGDQTFRRIDSREQQLLCDATKQCGD